MATDDKRLIGKVLAALDEANADVPSDDYITLDELREYVGRALTEYHRLLMERLGANE